MRIFYKLLLLLFSMVFLSSCYTQVRPTGITENTEKSARASYDRTPVYIYFGKKYFCDSVKTPWLTSEKRMKICNRISELERSSGCTPPRAKPLSLWTDSSENTLVSLYDVNSKYTILVFWNPDNRKCKTEIAELKLAYDSLKILGIDVAVYAAGAMDSDRYIDWLEVISKNNLNWINVCDIHRHSNFRFEWDLQTLPLIYVLDAHKAIKARRIGADQVKDYIHHLEDPTFKGSLKMKEDERR